MNHSSRFRLHQIGIPDQSGFRKPQTITFARTDQTFSTLTALIMVVGFVALALFLIYLSTISRQVASKPKEVIVNHTAYAEDDISPTPDFDEPEITLVDAPVAESIELPIKRLSKIHVTATSVIETIDSKLGNGPDGIGDSTDGDKRKKGPSKPDIVPPYERWTLRYKVAGKNEYARLIDGFKIELASVHRSSNLIGYAFELANKKPSKRISTRSEEPRVYFVPTANSKVQRWNLELLKAADVETGECILVMFVPEEFCKKLLELEATNLQGKKLEEVKRTVFDLQTAFDLKSGKDVSVVEFVSIEFKKSVE